MCKACVILFCQMVVITLVFLTLNACYWIFPKLYYYIADKIGKYSRVAMVIEHSSDYADYLFNWPAYKRIFRSRLEKLTKKEVHLYSPAINVTVISETTGEKHSLLDYSTPGRPLVISFSSVTCPIYLSYIQAFNDLVEKRSGEADFLVVYVRETHAHDEWRFQENAPHVIRQHVSMEQRLTASRLLRTQYHVACNIVADCMDNIYRYWSLVW